MWNNAPVGGCDNQRLRYVVALVAAVPGLSNLLGAITLARGQVWRRFLTLSGFRTRQNPVDGVLVQTGKEPTMRPNCRYKTRSADAVHGQGNAMLP